jgi:hypothetical protein
VSWGDAVSGGFRGGGSRGGRRRSPAPGLARGSGGVGLAEAEGFEPSMDGKAQTALAVCWPPSGGDHSRPVAAFKRRSGAASRPAPTSACHPRPPHLVPALCHLHSAGRVSRRARPRPSRWPLGQLRARPAHVPPHELADDTAARTAALRVYSSRRSFERLPLIVGCAEAAGGVVLGVWVGRHAARVAICSHRGQDSALIVVATNNLSPSLALWPQRS